MPEAPVRMSHGLIALPPGMFSVIGTIANRVIGNCCCANRAQCRDHRGAAGHVVLHALHAVGRLHDQAAGSNVIPLPTRPSVLPAGAPDGDYLRTSTAAVRRCRATTPSRRPMFRAAIFFSSRIGRRCQHRRQLRRLLGHHSRREVVAGSLINRRAALIDSPMRALATAAIAASGVKITLRE